MLEEEERKSPRLISAAFYGARSPREPRWLQSTADFHQITVGEMDEASLKCARNFSQFFEVDAQWGFQFDHYHSLPFSLPNSLPLSTTGALKPERRSLGHFSSTHMLKWQISYAYKLPKRALSGACYVDTR